MKPLRLPLTLLADAAAHLNVFTKDWVNGCTLPRRYRSNGREVYVNSALEGRIKYFTQAVEAFGNTLMRKMLVKPASYILDKSELRMSRMYLARRKVASARLSFANMVLMGADEMKLHNG